MPGEPFLVCMKRKDPMFSRPALLIGSTYSAERRDVENTIRRVMVDCEVRVADSVKAAVNLVRREDFFPDLVVVSQSWSDEFTRDEVEQLIAECALARIVVAYGPWCDSDGRNRSVWPLSVRVPVCLLEPRLQREVDVLSGRTEPLWLTANRDEIFAFDRGSDQLNAPTRDGRSSEVSIRISDPALRASVVAGLNDEGIRINDESRLTIYDADVDSTSNGIGLSAMPETASGRDAVSKLASVDALADAIHRK